MHGSRECKEINKERYGNNMPPIREERRNKALNLGPKIATNNKRSHSFEDIVSVCCKNHEPSTGYALLNKCLRN